MMKFSRFLGLTLMMLTGLVLCSIPASASELNFSVEPQIPDNQVDNNHTYFDLNVKPGSSETVTVKLRNATDKDVKVAVSPGRAYTNSSGVVQYDSTQKKDLKKIFDKTYPANIDFMNVVNAPKTVNIAPKQTISVPITIKMPDNKLQGVLAGGINFKQVNVDSDKRSQVINQYAYTVGVVLHGQKVKESKLTLGNIEAAQINYRNAIVAEVHNVSPTFVNQIKINGFITKYGKQKKLYTINSKINKNNPGKQVAPNSIYQLPFYLQGDKLKPGKYTMDLKLSSKGKSWHFKKNFAISNADTKLNKTDVNQRLVSWWMWALVAVGLGALLLLSFVLWRRQKNDKN
ncbi:DUF916 and DUF3324 domain-containing protein [Weissella minor]|uniref:DUF916 and DUF3324 domain-containing protein n=1 Tax=Weissella minor TaxID=1620 RepID=UPI003AF23192